MNKIIAIIGILLFAAHGGLKADGNERRVMLVLDMSSTMLAKDIAPNRLSRCKDLARIFVEDYPDVPIGLTVFAGEWKNLCHPDKDHSSILHNIKYAGKNLTDGTATGSALLCAASSLIGTGGTIILITDGVENCGAVSTSTAIEILKHYNIKLNVIGIGASGLVPLPYQMPEGEKIINVRLDIDHDYLSRMAESTGGRYYPVSTVRAFLDMIHEFKEPTWVEAPQGVSAAEDCRMTEDVMNWVIRRVTMGGNDIPMP